MAPRIELDVFAASDLSGASLATLVNAQGKMLRIEEDGAGVGGFRINRHSDEATASVLAKGNLVRVRIPEVSADYLGAFFLDTGDFDILASGEEGDELLSFGGRGAFSYLRRARMDAAAYSTGLDVSDTWTEIWRRGLTNPVGACLVNDDPTYLYVISSTTRKIYKIRQSDRAIVASTPALFSGGANACGLCADPSDSSILWALQSSLAGGSGNTKIRKIDISGAISTWSVVDTFDLGSSIQLSDIESDSTHLWTTRFDGTTSLYKRSKTDGSVVSSYTISYQGTTQTGATGSSINGTEIALWYYGKKRALIASLSDPTTITDLISTTGLSAFGGAWTTEGGNDYFYPVSSTSDNVWKYQVTIATPHDPVDGEWRLDEGTPGAIGWRIVTEFTHADRPQHPVPDLTFSFTSTLDSNGNAWDSHPGTAEFTARILDYGDDTLLRLVPFGVTWQMDPTTLELYGYNADDFGTDRTSATFAAGKVRIVAGVNAAEALRRRMDDREVDSHMLVLGDDGTYARSVLDDLGYVREGGIATNLTDAGALEGTGDAELARQRRDGDAQAVVIPWGNRELEGKYLPGPPGSNGHYWVGDTVRVHTGAGAFDLNEVDRDVKAITIEELDNGDLNAVADLASVFLPIYDPVAPSSTGSGGSSIGGTSGAGSSTTTAAAKVTVKDKINGESYAGTIIESSDWGVSQPGTGRVEVSLRPRKLNEASDAELDAIADGQGIAWDAVLEAWVPVDLGAGVIEGLTTSFVDTAMVFGPDGAGGVTARYPSTGLSASATSSGDLTTTSSLADVTGCSVSLGVGTWIVAGIFDVLVNSDTDRTFEGHLDVGGADETIVAPLIGVGLDTGDRLPIVQAWRITVASTTTVKLRAKHSGGSAGDFTAKANSRILAWQAGGGTVTALPTVVAVGTSASGTGAVSPGLPAGHTTDDILLLFVQSANEAVTAPAGYAKLGPFVGIGTAAAASSTRLTVFWKRDNGSEAAPTVADPGDHALAIIMAIRGCPTSGDPFENVGTIGKRTASTTGSGSAGATSTDNCLVVTAFAHALDSASAVFSAPTNADLGSVTEQIDVATADGTGGGIGVVTGTREAEGPFGATTVTETSTVDVSTTFIMLPRGARPRFDRQVFQTAGVVDTWAKPSGAKLVDMAGIAGGGSGSAGRSAATAAGGGGGGGGHYRRELFQGGVLPASLNVTASAAGPATANTDGATGSAGGSTLIQISGGAILLRARGGLPGTAAASGAGGQGGAGGGQYEAGPAAVNPDIHVYGSQGAPGGAGGTTGASGSSNGDDGGGGGCGGATTAAGGVGGRSYRGGGGGGGGRSNTNFSTGGGSGSTFLAAGGATVGAKGADSPYPESFGGGGGASGNSASGPGGEGGWPGGGGGGGGSQSGAQRGGKGGDGVAVIITRC